MAVLRYCLLPFFVLLFVENAFGIKGSTISVRGQFPFQADLIISLQSSKTLYVTGSLISRNYILTTAGNVVNSSKITVIMGAYNVEEKDDPNRRTYDGVSFKVHERYNELTGANDIALIKLNATSEINKFIQVVPIPRFSYICLPLIGKNAVVSGWGNVEATTPVEYQVLRYAEIMIEDHKFCKSAFPHITYKQLCSRNQEKYFEESDVGAPLVLGKTLVGIASASGFGKPCLKRKQVYVRLDCHLEWIESNSDVIIGE